MQHVKPLPRALAMTWEAVSLPKLMLLIGPLIVVLIAIMSLALQLNRQLADQQQASLNIIANASIRNAAQLQRENLRLTILVHETQKGLAPEHLKLQRDLVNSRILILRNTFKRNRSSAQIQGIYAQVVQQWQVVDPMIKQWLEQQNQQALTDDLLTELVSLDQIANQLVTATQLHFEDRIMGWTNSSHFLNRLLTGASMSFLVIVLIMSYMTFLFFRTQSLNEKVLRLSERRLRAILDTIPDAVYRVDAKGTYLDYKPPKGATTATTDLPRMPTSEQNDQLREGVIGKQMGELLPNDVATLLMAGVSEALMSGQEILLEYRLNSEQPMMSRAFEARCIPSGTEEVQLIVRDITEVKEQEEASLRAQKLESLGVLAGGIAHDFNNLLTGMLGQASLAKAKLARGLPALEHINKAVISAERAADLTRQMLAYAGKGKFQIGPLNINQLIQDTTGLMETVLPNHAQLTLGLDEVLPLVQGDRGQIQQVVMNLFINAIEALGSNPDHKGSDESQQRLTAFEAERQHSITITTSTVAIEDESSGQPSPNPGEQFPTGLKPSQYVVIKFIDTGIGMDHATLSRIFDPFFSTKPKGHGLGLSATMGIIRTHGGTLQVQSQLGYGTTFTVWLPALEEVVIAQSKAVQPLGEPQLKRQSILVIDDEAAIREAIVDILVEDGFIVNTAASGREGIERFKAEHKRIGLIMLDMKMPGLNGKQTYTELKAIDPNLKVIFTSGDSEAESATQLTPAGHTTFLPKPYSAEILIQQVHQMIKH